MDSGRKNSRYDRIYQQLAILLEGHDDIVSRMTTIVAVLHHKMDYFFWTGFYLLNDGELTVGPYQGPLACILLKKNTGVCWAGINSRQTMLVPNVHEFCGHIACDSRSQSEIVVPVIDTTGIIRGVLDVDSKSLNSFDENDKINLEKIAKLVFHQ